MKLKHLLLAGVAAGAANMAMAGQTITFNGKIVTSTCEVAVDGTAGNATVTLPTVSTKDLAAANNTAGATRFVVSVTNCGVLAGLDPLPTKIKTRFLAHQVNGANLANTAVGGATNVAIQLLEDLGDVGSSTNAALDFSTTGYVTSATSQTPPDTTPAVTFPFIAQYIATGIAGAGTVQAIVDYELVYE